MKGIILAGGKGTRLWPLTAVTNKHLVPVGNIPMIEYPLYTLSQLNVDSVSIVAGGEHFQQIAQYLTTLHPSTNFSFNYQQRAGGIAQALSLTEQFVKDRKIAVILGDNVFEDNLKIPAYRFEKGDLGAMVFLKQVSDPKRFGVAEIRSDRIIGIEEKPKKPKSDLAVTGFYLYDSTVFDRIRKLKPSKRGEFEITDVNNLYLTQGRLGYHILEGFWSDSGTTESRKVCEEFVTRGLERTIASNSPQLIDPVYHQNN